MNVEIEKQVSVGCGIKGLLSLGRRRQEGGPGKGGESSFRGRSVTSQTQVLVKYAEASQGLSEDGGEGKEDVAGDRPEWGTNSRGLIYSGFHASIQYILSQDT